MVNEQVLSKIVYDMKEIAQDTDEVRRIAQWIDAVLDEYNGRCWTDIKRRDFIDDLETLSGYIQEEKIKIANKRKEYEIIEKILKGGLI
ncbi:MAG: hypothetical protein ABFD07_12230 [Methanobacterium sp.]